MAPTRTGSSHTRRGNFISSIVGILQVIPQYNPFLCVSVIQMGLQRASDIAIFTYRGMLGAIGPKMNVKRVNIDAALKDVSNSPTKIIE